MRSACAIAALAALVGCSEPEGITVVFVDVAARGGVTGVSRLEVTARNDSATVSESFDVGGRAFPLSFTITPEGREGTLDIEIRGLDGDDLLRGEGRATTTIETDVRVDVGVTLDPTDFVINADIAGTQRPTFNFEAAGRQLASNGDGFYAAFVNDCAMLGRCDVLTRRFDEDGTPAVNLTSMNDGEFIANLTSEFTAVPSVAIGKTSMFIAWQTNDAIKGVALSLDGDHLTALETLVSTTVDQQVGAPAVAALGSDEFIVVWEQTTEAGDREIRGRLIAANGVVTTNPTTGDTLDFPVSAPETGFATFPTVAPAGDQRGFVVAWKHATDFFSTDNVRARFFNDAGNALSAGNGRVTNLTRGDTFAPHVVSVGENLALVGYAVEDPDDPLLVAGAIVFQRIISPSGMPSGPPLVHQVEIPFQRPSPGIAVRRDGAMAAAWHQCDAAGDGQGCGVFVQQLRATGTPIGLPTQVNTTVAADQTSPSIAGLGDSFVVVWADESSAPPDTDQGAVRGRLVFLEAEPDDGRRGAHCGGPGDAACGTGLVCIPGAEGTPMCHIECNPASGAPCPTGGACSTVAGESGCTF